MPLDLALRQVLPVGWALKTETVASETLSKNVSWSGGRPWTQVLADLAQRGGVAIDVRWSDRVLVVARPAPSVVAAPSAVVAPSGAAKARPAALPVKRWVLDPAKTLRENVQAWVDQAGWNQLVWDGADYPIAAPATFTGEFASPEGPLARLIRAYEQSDQPLRVKLSSMDRVVHVTNKNPVQNRVPQDSPQRLAPSSFD